ncbi:Bug family tripartite tricarboxylate transporter substrate binding protein [Candidimonas nitroreducens]|nr:tripartite tricarboxylate transporter substrate binding protein [Candidimonas nitroreducens]
MLAGLLGIFSCSTPAPAHGAKQDIFPSHPVKIIVPYSPGGTTDSLARVLATELSKKWHQSVVVENRPGATGTIGLETVATSPPDGYTLGIATFGNMLVANAIRPQLRYKPLTDLVPVIQLAAPPLYLIANAKQPYSDVKGLIAYAKAHPDKLHYGSSGTGSSNHLFGELFASMAGISMIHVPYKGSGPSVTDTLSGIIDLNFAPFPLIKGYIGSPRIKVLGVTSAHRSPVAPSIPTIAEAGLPGYEAISWFGVAAPAGIPKPLLERLNKDINAALKNDEVKHILASEGTVPTGGSLAQARKSVEEGMRKWGGMVKKLHLIQ